MEFLVIWFTFAVDEGKVSPLASKDGTPFGADLVIVNPLTDCIVLDMTIGSS